MEEEMESMRVAEVGDPNPKGNSLFSEVSRPKNGILSAFRF
jgi:hypothetical protein